MRWTNGHILFPPVSSIYIQACHNSIRNSDSITFIFYLFQRTKRGIKDRRSAFTHSKLRIVTVTVAVTASLPLRFLLPLHVLPRISNCPGCSFVEIMAVIVHLYRIGVLVWNDRRFRWKTSHLGVLEESRSYLFLLIWRKVCLTSICKLRELRFDVIFTVITSSCRIGKPSAPTTNVRKHARIGESSCQSCSGDATSTASSSSIVNNTGNWQGIRKKRQSIKSKDQTRDWDWNRN